MSQKGFTLIELLLVVAIIGLLAGIAVPMFTVASEKAKDRKVITDMRNIAISIGIYRISEDRVPDAVNGIALVAELKDKIQEAGQLFDRDVWGNEYIYLATKDGTSYSLLSYGKDKKPGPSWATIEDFEADADTLIANGVFIASHGGNTVVAY